MIKKILLSIALFTIIVSLASCGGSGGTTGVPEGVNPGVPSVVQLLDVQNIVQTNSSAYFKAKVLDGNGNPVPNEPVTFINLSPIGAFLGSVGSPSEAQAASSNIVLTDNNGFATIRLFSPVSGFATVQAEVNTGSGQVRDKRTVYFTTFSLILLPSLTLDVDSNLNETYNEADDFTILDDGNVVRIKATVYDRFGLPASGIIVTFATDVPYRVGQDPDAECSDESDFCEIVFPFGNIRTTGGDGEAFVDIVVFPTTLRPYQTLFNVTAEADNGAFNMVTLYLNSITVATVDVSANPTTVESGGSSTITAFATMVAAVPLPVPEGTTINFTISCSVTNCGGIEPFAQTDANGIATVTFTAPTLAEGATDLVVIITAKVAGMSDTTTVTVTAEPLEPAELTIVPPTWTADGTAGDTRSFTITGGTPPYIVNSTDPFRVFDSGAGDGVWDVAASGDTFTATVPASSCPGDVDLDVSDAIGGTTSATVTIVTSTPLSILPTSATICENDGACGAGTETATFTISGGTAPYSVLSSSIGVITNPVTNPFTVDAIDSSITADTTVNLTVSDSCPTTLPVVPIFVINQP